MQQTEVTDHLNMHWREIRRNMDHIWCSTLWTSNCHQNQARSNLILVTDGPAQIWHRSQSYTTRQNLKVRGSSRDRSTNGNGITRGGRKTNKGIGPNSPPPANEMLIPMPKTAENTTRWRRRRVRPPAHGPRSNAAWMDHPRRVRTSVEPRGSGAKGGGASNA